MATTNSGAPGRRVLSREEARVRQAQRITLTLAVLAALGLAFFPLYSAVTEDSAGNVTEVSSTLLEENGMGALPIMIAPVILTLVPLIVPWPTRRITTMVCTALLGAYCVLGILTIGIPYMPAFISQAITAFLWRSVPRQV